MATGSRKAASAGISIQASRRELEDLLARRLLDLDIGAVFLDRIHRGGHCGIVALGVTRDGGKHCLELWQGPSRLGPCANHCCRISSTAVWIPNNAGYSSSMERKRYPSVIRKKFRGSEIQRCQIHK